MVAAGLTGSAAGPHTPPVRFPHPLTLLTGCVLAAAVASHVLPAGEYERRIAPATRVRGVVAGTSHAAARRPGGPVQAAAALPPGDAAPAAALLTVLRRRGAL